MLSRWDSVWWNRRLSVWKKCISSQWSVSEKSCPFNPNQEFDAFFCRETDNTVAKYTLMNSDDTCVTNRTNDREWTIVRVQRSLHENGCKVVFADRELRLLTRMIECFYADEIELISWIAPTRTEKVLLWKRNILRRWLSHARLPVTLLANVLISW